MNVKHHLIFALATLFFVSSIFYSLYTSQSLLSPSENFNNRECIAQLYYDENLCNLETSETEISCCLAEAVAKFSSCKTGENIKKIIESIFNEEFAKNCNF